MFLIPTTVSGIFDRVSSSAPLLRECADLFVYDDESHYCYFNPSTFETSDQFFLVGVVLGLAIYNSTILEVALPPFAFRKLLASAPSYTGPTTLTGRPSATPTLADLAEFRRESILFSTFEAPTEVTCSFFGNWSSTAPGI